MTSHPSRNNRELRDNANEPIRFLLISNMYPGRHHLFFGIFVRNTEKGLVENGIEVDRIVISDKSRKIFEKIWKVAIFLFHGFFYVFSSFLFLYFILLLFFILFFFKICLI